MAARLASLAGGDRPVLILAILALAGALGCGEDTGTPPILPGNLFYVRPGTFTMGSFVDEIGRDADELPHEVTLSRGFYISGEEVTQAEWVVIMGWNRSRVLGPDLPAETLTWFDAIEYCIRRSQVDGLIPAYSLDNPRFQDPHIVEGIVAWNPEADGYRLPTEAEWEYACRAGRGTAFSNGPITIERCGLDPFLSAIGWYCGNARNQIHPVRLKDPNGWDLYDMHGNVWEWCWDWYGPYPESPVIDPMGPQTGAQRIARGGSYASEAQHCRSAYRHGLRPGTVSRNIGLRVVRSSR